MNEIIWLTISFLIVLIFSYKPIKIRLKKFTDNHIYNTQKLINEAKKTHDEAQKYLQKLEIEITEQNKLNAEKLAQSKHLMNSIKLQSEKEIEQEVKKQLEIAEMQRKKEEEVIKKEITLKFLSKNIQKIVKEMNRNQKSSSFLSKALSELDEIKIKN